MRWRCVDLQLRIARVFGVQLHERTVGKLLRRLLYQPAGPLNSMVNRRDAATCNS